MVKVLLFCVFFFAEKYAHLVGLEPGLRGKTFIIQVIQCPIQYIYNNNNKRYKRKTLYHPKFLFGSQRVNKQHHSKVLLNSFPMNGYALGFCP